MAARLPVEIEVVARLQRARAGGVEHHLQGEHERVDAAETAARVSALGGKVIEPVHEDAMFRRAVIADPEGATISISEKITG